MMGRMATVLQIVRAGHPALSAMARPVVPPFDDRLKRLVADLFATMDAAGGIGLAAPQVGESLRVIVFGVAGDSSVPRTAVINPEIEVLGTRTAEAMEGCLSLPGICAPVRRPDEIRYTGWSPDGTRIDRQASGLHARVVQHEVDHLDGTLFVSRVEHWGQFGYVDALGLGPRRPE